MKRHAVRIWEQRTEFALQRELESQPADCEHLTAEQWACVMWWKRTHTYPDTYCQRPEEAGGWGSSLHYLTPYFVVVNIFILNVRAGFSQRGTSHSRSEVLCDAG